jgi:ribosomal-protein-alanine N-acetyltransferase
MDQEGYASPPVLRTPRLLMRLLKEGDCAEFIRVHRISEDFFRPWMPMAPARQTLEQLFTAQLKRACRGWATGTNLRMVAELDDGRLAGFFNLNEIVMGSFRCSYAGWRVNVEVARQGYATEAVNGLLDLAFAAAPRGLGLHRVQANIIPANEASIALATRCGFRREGLAVRYLEVAGRWQDHVMFAKLADEHTPLYLT